MQAGKAMVALGSLALLGSVLGMFAKADPAMPACVIASSVLLGAGIVAYAIETTP